jgi:hypothetical protein
MHLRSGSNRSSSSSSDGAGIGMSDHAGDGDGAGVSSRGSSNRNIQQGCCTNISEECLEYLSQQLKIKTGGVALVVVESLRELHLHPKQISTQKAIDVLLDSNGAVLQGVLKVVRVKAGLQANVPPQLRPFLLQALNLASFNVPFNLAYEVAPGYKMVELLVLLGLHIDYPSDTPLTSEGLRETLSPARGATEDPITKGPLVEGGNDKEDKGESEEEAVCTSRSRSSSAPPPPLDEDQYVVACGEWMVHLFQTSRSESDLGGRVLFSPLPHWREGPAGAAEVAVASALLSTGDTFGQFTTWEDRFSVLRGTLVGPVATPITEPFQIPSVTSGTSRQGGESKIGSKTIHSDDWNSAIGTPLPVGVLGTPRTRTSSSSDFTIKFHHEGSDLFLFVAVTLEEMTAGKIRAEVELVPQCLKDSEARAVLLIPFLRGGDKFQRLASEDVITYDCDSTQELCGLGEPPEGVQVVILMPQATKTFLGERVVDHLLKSHELTPADVLNGICLPQSNKMDLATLMSGMNLSGSAGKNSSCRT